MKRVKALSAAMALALALSLQSCAGRSGPKGAEAAAQPAAPATAPAAASPATAAEEKPVTWDPAVWAAFQKEVPRFVQALAKERIEEMARENGSCFVDQALYDKAMAEYRK